MMRAIDNWFCRHQISQIGRNHRRRGATGRPRNQAAVCAPLQPVIGHSGVTEVPGDSGVPAACAGGDFHEPVRGFRCDDVVVDGAEMEVPLTGGWVARAWCVSPIRCAGR